VYWPFDDDWLKFSMSWGPFKTTAHMYFLAAVVSITAGFTTHSETGPVACGVHAGGFNASFDATVPSQSKFDPDENWTYELGVKGTFQPYDGTVVQVSFAGFYSDWKDLQIATVSEGGGITNPIQIIGKAEIYGLELEVNSTLTENFDLSFGYAYADPVH
jgi:outer membrane receptor for monomeric catechols